MGQYKHKLSLCALFQAKITLKQEPQKTLILKSNKKLKKTKFKPSVVSFDSSSSDSDSDGSVDYCYDKSDCIQHYLRRHSSFKM